MAASIDWPEVRSRVAPAHANDSLAKPSTMKELLRTNDTVRLSFLQSLLRDSGIESLVLDHHTSLVEGSIGAIPRRLMVAQRDYYLARSVLAAAGEAVQ
jgi:Putative prokaryotic signal transducing protein